MQCNKMQGNIIEYNTVKLYHTIWHNVKYDTIWYYVVQYNTVTHSLILYYMLQYTSVPSAGPEPSPLLPSYFAPCSNTPGSANNS